ncbi:GAT domain-containing protein [Histoplasma capsulatum G186AR]|uniref:GAT domain-containing protein n=1 Tax=Ajellomyces capsulatus TaxID=5037 RepID=A0A8H7YVR0_AJECA|nr:GAT domain-containing protein [Histoplasma capsulatum]QSS73230.1 GAT domain-containing protein [Histoplasma capsulatum G186AR]
MENGRTEIKGGGLEVEKLDCIVGGSRRIWNEGISNDGRWMMDGNGLCFFFPLILMTNRTRFCLQSLFVFLCAAFILYILYRLVCSWFALCC